MRDDIHRGAPVPVAYRRCMKACASDAEWFARSGSLARAAIVDEIRAEVRGSFIAEITSEGFARQGSLLPSDPMILPRPVTPDSGLERAIVSHAARRAAKGERVEACVRGAIGDAISERVAAQKREMEGHVARKDPLSRREFSSRMAHAIKTADVDSIARDLVSGRLPTRVSTSQSRVDLDEDIRGGYRK